jgi:hypothetical protein
MAALPAGAHPFPRARWAAALWLALYVPAYASTYGWLNFLFLCNLGVMLTALALWRGQALLLSSQALAAPIISLVWTADVLARLLTGQHLFGGTAYMWDPQFPLFTRLLSCYHVAWPLVVWLALRRTGYDPRGLALQVGLALVAVVAGRWADPAFNINYAHTDPFFRRELGGPAAHVAAVVAALTLVYAATHALLRRVLPASATPGRAAPAVPPGGVGQAA